ncbi:MAG: ECF transporter S component [Candidatus Methanofastidiosia archaeon]
MNSREIAIRASFTALVCVATIVLVVPIPATGGYFNLGETAIYIAAMLFGGITGGFVGGVGSAMADLLLGFGAFAPITLVVKGTEGFIVGKISREKSKKARIIALTMGGAILVFGYFIFESYMWGFPAAMQELPFNFLQFASGAVISLAVVTTLEKKGIDIRKKN